MAETNKESTCQEPSTPAGKKAAADEKAAATSRESETKPAADLLISILNDVQERVQTRAAIAAPTAAEERLVGKALEAVDQFREIVAALALAGKPAITLQVDDSDVFTAGDLATLTWTSTGHRVSLTEIEVADINGTPIPGKTEKDLGVVTPAARGSIDVPVPFNFTQFKATADPCDSNFDTAVAQIGDGET